jgi:hypothetical protein
VFIANRKSPKTPAPVPAVPPELLSVFNVTVNAAAIAMCAEATVNIAAHKIDRVIRESSLLAGQSICTALNGKVNTPEKGNAIPSRIQRALRYFYMLPNFACRAEIPPALF